jgi:SAM-dependent methyltransferase
VGGRRRTFQALYGVGFAPWDGHALASSLTELIEGGTLTRGRALDIGCGTGDNAIYLARNGWRVTGVDFVDKPLQAARAKASAIAGLSVDFVKADATQLRKAGVGPAFDLILDSGCLHGMDGRDRLAYVDEVTAVAAPGARLLIVAFVPGGTMSVRGITPIEVERRFASGWEMSDQGDEPSLDPDGKGRARYYLLRRAQGSLSPRRREIISQTTALTNDFDNPLARGAERMLEQTKFWPEPIRRILWGRRSD